MCMARRVARSIFDDPFNNRYRRFVRKANEQTIVWISWEIHWFEEYLKIIERDQIDVHFSNERSFYAFLTPSYYLSGLHPGPFGPLLFGSSRYKFTVNIRALACPVVEIYTVID